MADEELGGYRLLEQLGSGGMGVVHLGVDAENQPVAVKVLHPHIAGDETARIRLAREVRTLRRIRHPRIAEVLDAELEAERPFIVTEFVDGQTLSDDVRANGPFAEDELVHFGHALLDALNAVHVAGVIHRDLKPANVMIMDGEPMVIDFGIAQAADEVKVTATGLVMGTPGYLSPEIADGRASSEKTDWWGWAATMAFAATGRNPYGSGPLEAVLGRVALGKCDLEGAPPRFIPLLRACLDPKPERRPSGAMILQALVDIESGRMPALGGAAASQIPLPSRDGQTMHGQPRPSGPPREHPPHGSGPAHPGAQPASAPHPGQGAPGHGAPGQRSVYRSDAQRPYGALTLDSRQPQQGGHPHPNGQPHRPSQFDPAQMAPPAEKRLRPLWALLALNLLGVGLAALGPFVALALAYLWQVAARTVGRMAKVRSWRQLHRGPGSVTVWSSIASAPGALLSSLITSVLSSFLPAVAAFAVVVLMRLDIAGIVPAARSDQLALAVSAAVFGLVLWFGPGSENLRHGSTLMVASAGRSRRGDVVLAGVLVVLAFAAAMTALGGGATMWFPLQENPLHIIPDVADTTGL